ncbi:Long-chain fatty acid transport protein 4 [Frankliniella fusca]|uniref:Long-chain fatty acid transport protein 4 n=1 Tax=Frankliniella fusca TaxID=407009 RepID=A0AAE1LAX3_9NEOP|nr:Long-chain fatty acid transport protein 4 [Frankliniella fusca]
MTTEVQLDGGRETKLYKITSLGRQAQAEAQVRGAGGKNLPPSPLTSPSARAHRPRKASLQTSAGSACLSSAREPSVPLVILYRQEFVL